MSEPAESLQRLATRVDAAAGALVRARFAEFAEFAAELEAAETACLFGREGFHADAAAEAACHTLRRSLDRLAALLGHIAGVRQALGGIDPAHMAAYDRSGAGVGGGRTLVRKEA